MSELRWIEFANRLDEAHTWPCVYLFKFVMPADRVTAMVAIFGKHEFSTRPSRNGRYVSVTAEISVLSADQVVAIYRAASVHEGVISL